MRVLIFTGAILFLSCGQNSSETKKEEVLADTKTTTPSSDAGIKDSVFYTTPDEAIVNGSLKARYGSKWHLLNDSEAKWMKDAFDYFIVARRKNDPNYPYIAKGDYNADGKQDTAAVVTDSLKTNYQLAILMGGGNNLLWKEDILEDAALSTIPKSEIDGMVGEKTKKIKMKGDGINVEYFEKAAFVLYWDKNNFKRIQTAD